MKKGKGIKIIRHGKQYLKKIKICTLSEIKRL